MPESTLEARAVQLLNLIAEEKRPCRKCQAPIWMVRHQNGKVGPYTADLHNHFANCPHAAEFRKRQS